MSFGNVQAAAKFIGRAPIGRRFVLLLTKLKKKLEIWLSSFLEDMAMGYLGMFRRAMFVGWLSGGCHFLVPEVRYQLGC